MSDTQQRIDALVKSSDILLFMEMYESGELKQLLGSEG